jgi:hypothetical protein
MIERASARDSIRDGYLEVPTILIGDSRMIKAAMDFYRRACAAKIVPFRRAGQAQART